MWIWDDLCIQEQIIVKFDFIIYSIRLIHRELQPVQSPTSLQPLLSISTCYDHSTMRILSRRRSQFKHSNISKFNSDLKNRTVYSKLLRSLVQDNSSYHEIERIKYLWMWGLFYAKKFTSCCSQLSNTVKCIGTLISEWKDCF